MKSKIYKIKAFDTLDNRIHNKGHFIHELYIPRYKLSINKYGNINIFRPHESRYKDESCSLVKELILDTNTLSMIKKIYRTQNNLNKMKDNIINNIDTILK